MRGDVIWVTSSGIARLDRPWPSDGAVRLAASDAACAALLRAAAPPAECGPDVPVAPARGPTVSFVPRAAVLSADGGVVVHRSGHRAFGEVHRRHGVRRADAFDLMEAQSRRSFEAQNGDAPFVPPFTEGHKAMGRAYAALVERVEASGVKCSSLEALRAGGGPGGDLEVAVIRDIRALRAMRARIGDGLAKEVRRIRPSQNGGATRVAIRVRSVVDMVCLGDLTIAKVLERHGWCAKDSAAVKHLRKALCGALDRMIGYR